MAEKVDDLWIDGPDGIANAPALPKRQIRRSPSLDVAGTPRHIGCPMDWLKWVYPVARNHRFFIATSRDGADALFVDGSPENITKRQLIDELAAKFRLPAIYAFRSFVEAGGLMAYGTELGEVFRQAARSIDNILRGTNPGDVPYYQPTKFELVINLGAARALGLTTVFSVQPGGRPYRLTR